MSNINKITANQQLFNKVTPEEAEVISGGATIIEKGVDFFGNDITVIPNSNLSACRDAVDRNPEAAAGTFKISDNLCFLKSSTSGKTQDPNAIGIIQA